MKTDVEGLAAAVASELERYSQSVTDEIKRDVRTVSKECVEEIKASAPVRRGRYRSGWKSKVAFESGDDIRVIVHNSTDYQLTHLLENGHAKVNGGRVEARPHIRPAEENAAKKLVSKVKVIVKG